MTDVATLYVRNISPEAVARIKRRAEARGLTVGAYLEKLEALHGALLQDEAWEMCQEVLIRNNLGRVVD